MMKGLILYIQSKYGFGDLKLHRQGGFYAASLEKELFVSRTLCRSSLRSAYKRDV